MAIKEAQEGINSVASITTKEMLQATSTPPAFTTYQPSLSTPIASASPPPSPIYSIFYPGLGQYSAALGQYSALLGQYSAMHGQYSDLPGKYTAIP